MNVPDLQTELDWGTNGPKLNRLVQIAFSFRVADDTQMLNTFWTWSSSSITKNSSDVSGYKKKEKVCAYFTSQISYALTLLCRV